MYCYSPSHHHVFIEETSSPAICLSSPPHPQVVSSALPLPGQASRGQVSASFPGCGSFSPADRCNAPRAVRRGEESFHLCTHAPRCRFQLSQPNLPPPVLLLLPQRPLIHNSSSRCCIHDCTHMQKKNKRKKKQAAYVQTHAKK